MTRILITGATGFIGSHLARRLVCAGHEVSALARPQSDTGRIADLLGRINVVRTDLTNPQTLAPLLARIRPEVVFHLAMRTRFAAPSPDVVQQALRANLPPLQALLSACTAVPDMHLFLRIGSIAEYGSAPVPYHEGLRETPNSAYGMSALAGTHFLHAARAALPFTAGTARLALTYGPAQSEDFLLPQLIKHCQTGTPLVLQRPEDRRDMIHVDDVTEALVRLADLQDDLPPLVNIGTGRAPTMRELASIVANAAGRDPSLFPARCVSTDPPNALRVDPQLLTRTLGWHPHISLENGVAQMLNAAAPHLTGTYEWRSA